MSLSYAAHKHRSARLVSCQTEIRDILELVATRPFDHVFLIPARLEPCDVPLEVLQYHWVDLFETNGYRRLREALDYQAAKTHRINKECESKTVRMIRTLPQPCGALDCARLWDLVIIIRLVLFKVGQVEISGHGRLVKVRPINDSAFN